MEYYEQDSKFLLLKCIAPDKIDAIVLAACILHNFIKKKQCSYMDNQIAEEIFPIEKSIATATNPRRPSTEALKIREELKNYRMVKCSYQ